MTRRLTKLILAIACTAPLLAPTAAADVNSNPVKKTIRAQDGLNIYCETRGQGNTTLLFLHGWCGDHEYWKNQAAALAPDYRIVTLDQAGHGQSGKDRAQWTVNSLAADVESVVRTLNLKRVILIGHSMGGPVSLAAAKRLPGKVVAVIGVDTLQNADFKMSDDASKQILDRFAADYKGTLQTTFPALLPEKVAPELKQWLLAKAEGQDPKMAVGLMRNLTAIDTKALLTDAKVPIRCINSAGGYPFFTPTAIEVNRKYADFKAVLIDNVGHYPMLEKPDEFNRLLREVLKEFAARQ